MGWGAANAGVRRSSTVCGALIGVFGLIGAAIAGDLVVVRAQGAKLAPGAKIDAEHQLILTTGESVTLIAADGHISHLRGPYAGRPATTPAIGLAETMKGLIAAQGDATAKLGVTRSVTARVEPPEPWLIDVSTNGHRCVIESRDSLVLWRPEPVRVAGGDLRPVDGTFNARLKWPTDANRLRINTRKLPLRDGQRYQVELDGTLAAITVHAVPDGLASDQMRVAWLVEMGCVGQAASLMKTLQP